MFTRGRGVKRFAPAAKLAGLACGVLLVCASGANAAFPQDPPNDPAFDPAEQGGTPTCLSESVNDEQHYLYSNMPQCSPAATDAEGSSGMFIAPNAHSPAGEHSAWRDYTAGNPNTVIAYVEGGINWHLGDANELRNRVYLNAGELPAPTNPDSQPGLNADDFAVYNGTTTPDANGNHVVDPEDIIVRFSEGIDDDGNGYTDDISGWDFYNGQNDPATLDSTYNHANGQQKQVAAEANNGEAGAGVCPRCRVLPVKAGAEALDRTDDLAQAWLFAGDSGADVIISVTADLGYSTFMSQAVDHLWHQGVVMVQASNDFNSTDHQGGMFHPHVLPGNSVVSNTQGIPSPLANALTTTYRARSSYPEWGTHNMFTTATDGGTTSDSTPTLGGVMALVLAYGKEAVAPGGPLAGRPALSGPEAIQVVRDTASDINGNPSAPLPGWEGKPGFDLQYGYGRPNVLKAMQRIEAGEIPPVAWIDSPDWYSLYDPTKTAGVPVTGHVEARRSTVASWKLEFAPGAEPTGGDFITANTGSSATDGPLGSIDLSQVPASFWQKAFQLSATKSLETNEEYTVTIRVQVTDADGRVGEERRTIAVQHDPSLVSGFPKKIGPSGDSQPVLADLNGSGQLDIIFGDADGVVHAIKPNGSEEPGFPVTTNPVQVIRQHSDVDSGHEPIFSGVAVGDLDGNGRLSIVATSSSGRSYVWDHLGQLRPGWPNVLEDNVIAPGTPRPEMPFTRQRVRGASAAPVLADMNGDGALEVVQAGWDGAVHLWKADGSNLTAPIRPPKPSPSDPALIVINDQKLVVPPAVAQLDDDPLPEIVVRSQYNESPGGDLAIVGVNGTVPPKSHLYAYNGDGSVVSAGWNPATIDAIAMYYGSAQEFITEGANAPVSADIDGDGKSEVMAAAGIFSPDYKISSDGSVGAPFSPVPSLSLFANLLNGTLSPASLTDLLNGDLPADVPVNFTTSGAFGRFGAADTLSYAEPKTGGASVTASLLLAGSGVPVNNYLTVSDASSGASLVGPSPKTQGLDFVGAPVIADVTGDGKAEVIEGGDSSAMHAFTEGGAQAAGFPKFNTGWVLFGPAVGDIDSDGRSELIAMTREGYLMAWKTDGVSAGNNEWWNYRHDERNTAQYGLDTRPPGVTRESALGLDGKLTLKAPGDDWYAGTADHYLVRIGSGPPTSYPVSGPNGTMETIQLPAGTVRASVQTVDDAGNLGTPITISSGGAAGGTGDCANLIAGTRRRDRLRGSDQGDRLTGKRGADKIAGNAGNDCLVGAGGRDLLNGGPGLDQYSGGRGRDRIKAIDGVAETVSCGKGRDRAALDASDTAVGCEKKRVVG